MNNTELVLNRCAVILPSLNPTKKLCDVVESLTALGFADIVVIDDGSDSAHKAPFEQVGAFEQVTVLTHDINRGKGAALKTAFAYLQENRSDLLGAITADGDGQHLAKDILRCGEALVGNEDSLIMGCRNFDLPHVPAKSKKGNKITSFIFRAGCGIVLSDTQTGLRAAGTKLFPALLEISGERYEYETNMLLELFSQGVRFTEVEIETVYEDNNSGSHFRPVRDSARIYKLILKHIFKKLYRFFRYVLSSCASSVIDLLAFWLLHMLLAAPLGELAVGASTAAARVISSFFNFNVNKSLVFGSGGNYGKAMVRYYILCALQLCVSAILVWLLGKLFAASASWLLTLLKAAVDTALFFISYQIQRKWVFKDK